MNGAALFLEDRLDLRSVAALAQALADRRGSDLTLDASAVRQIGALAVQVLRAAARSWAEDGYRLTFVGPSNDVVDQLALLGFTPDTLMQWEAAR